LSVIEVNNINRTQQSSNACNQLTWLHQRPVQLLHRKNPLPTSIPTSTEISTVDGGQNDFSIKLLVTVDEIGSFSNDIEVSKWKVLALYWLFGSSIQPMLYGQ
jgi:hypothetical protein